MEKNKWGVGAVIWFGFYILTQWLMCIEYATRPSSAYQDMALIYGIDGAIGTALILWLAISRTKKPMICIFVCAAISAGVMLVQGSSGILCLGPFFMPFITWLIVRRTIAEE